mmetsp:Transcript_115697/g.248579  ORF Transcript_115697/g.248579 Transcript_115697/m.248579 type:complete len:263 (-) Transcript_115697:365-1153(-)
MTSTAASTPAEMLVCPCRGSGTARMAAGDRNDSPSTVASASKTVSEHGPLAKCSSSEKQARASPVLRPMLPLLSSTKWKRVGVRCRLAGWSALSERLTAQTPSSSSAQRARAVGSPLGPCAPATPRAPCEAERRGLLGDGTSGNAAGTSATSERARVRCAGGGGGAAPRRLSPRATAPARPREALAGHAPDASASATAPNVSAGEAWRCFFCHHAARRSNWRSCQALPLQVPRTTWGRSNEDAAGRRRSRNAASSELGCAST